MLVKAAVVYDALAINKHIVNQRQKLYHERTINVPMEPRTRLCQAR